MTTATATIRWGEVREWKEELEVALLPGSFAIKENRDTSQCPGETMLQTQSGCLGQRGSGLPGVDLPKG